MRPLKEKYITARPAKFQEKIFSQLFEQAEIAQFDESEYDAYEDSLKARSKMQKLFKIWLVIIVLLGIL